MAQNDTVLARIIGQPEAPRIGHDPVATFKSIVGYITRQREMLGQMYSNIVRVVSERHMAGTLADRPPPEIKNRTYLVEDTVPMRLSIDDGTNWHDILLP